MRPTQQHLWRVIMAKVFEETSYMNQTLLRATCAALITLTASAASASCYTIYNGKGNKGDSIRVFPSSNWTE